MRLSRLSLLLIAFLALAAAALGAGPGSAAPARVEPDAAAATLVLNPTEDAWINQLAPSTNYGVDRQLRVGRATDQTGAAGSQITLLKFDLAKLPANAVVNKATLELTQSDASGADAYSIEPDVLTAAWSEGGVTYNTRPGLAHLGDPAVVLGLADGVKTWDVTKIVQAWKSGQQQPHGIGLRGLGSAIAQRVFWARNTDTPPRLIIDYVIPTATPTPTRTPTRTPTATPTTAAPIFALPYLPASVIKLPPILPQGDLALHGIEVTQGIQCFDPSKGLATCPDNSLPLVARKSTAARVYIKYTGPGSSLNNVPVRLVLRDANNTEYVVNTSSKGLPTINQADAANSANIYFTVNFSGQTQVRFYAIVDPANAIAETNEGNNRWPASGYLTLNFTNRDTLKIVGQRLRYHPSGYSGSQYAGGWAVNGGAANWFEQMLPIRNGGVNYSVKSGYLDWTARLSGNSDSDTDGARQHDLIKTLNLYWLMENTLSLLFGSGAFTGADHLYGWVPNDGYSGGHADMPVYPHAGGLGVVGIGTDRPGTSTDAPGGGALIMGHELVHDYDIFHTNTGGDDCGSNDNNSDFPYSTSSIQEFGFNPVTGKVYDPATTHDLMSYCPAGGSREGWISPFTWQKMFGDLATTALNAYAATADQPNVGILYETDAAESLMVRATLLNPTVTGEVMGKLGPLHKVGTGLAYEVPRGDYAIEQRAGGQTLRRTAFAVDFRSEYANHGDSPTADEPPFTPNPALQADVTFVTPWEAGATSVVLLFGDQILDQRAVSANAPEVIITAPAGSTTWPAGSTQTLMWESKDVDGNTMTYAVLYSHDGGASWALLADDLATTSFAVEVDSLAGGPDARFRVVATDGIHTGFDETDGPINVPNKAPVPVILSPEHGSAHTPGALVLLEGSGIDMEDGPLGDASLAWTSDRAGLLGTGGTVPLNNLAAGRHVISLTATDSLGVKTSASVTIFIGELTRLPIIVR